MAGENDREIQQLRNRLKDLADKSFQQNMFTFTGFLSLGEQDVFWRLEPILRYAGYTLFGGAEDTDRKMLRFGNASELGYEVPFPIVCVHVKPLVVKFADQLSHRDFLGALMNLGIERNVMGDIKVGDREAYLFCEETMADYICQNLDQVKHTHVSCSIVEDCGEIPEEVPDIQTVQVPSLRVDAVIAKIYNKSRSDCLEMFRAGKVFIDGRLCENNARNLKPGECVNARGYGKFTIEGEVRETRKGKLAIQTAIYR